MGAAGEGNGQRHPRRRQKRTGSHLNDKPQRDFRMKTTIAAAATIVFLACTLVAPAGQDKAPAAKGRGTVVLSEEARRIHADALVVDGHNDLPWRMRDKGEPFAPILDITQSVPRLHTDIPRLRKGNLGAQFWSAYVPAELMRQKTAVKVTMEQIDLIHRMVKKYADTFEMAATADDVVRIRKQGKIASMIGVEGGHSIDNSLGVLRIYHELGVRYMTLTHSDNLDWADSATDEPKLKGLSTFGERVVLEMNRIGMLVDISHISADTMRHVLRVTKAPVIASHSSAYALAQHPRNVPDDVLELVKKNRGVIMVNFYPGFVMPDGARQMKEMFAVGRELKAKYPNEKEFQEAYEAWRKDHPFSVGSVHDVVDHIEHIIKIAGIDAVGLGSDYDGIGAVPRQLEDVSCYPFITQVLLDRGYSRQDIHKVLGANALRVLRDAEKVAASMK
jgi:membrane dipeptidase